MFFVGKYINTFVSADETLNVGDFVIKRTKKEEFVLKSNLKNSESVVDAKFGNQVSVNKQTQKRKFDFLADDEEPSPILKKRRRRKKRPVTVILQAENSPLLSDARSLKLTHLLRSDSVFYCC